MVSALAEDSFKVYARQRAYFRNSRCPCKSSESPQSHLHLHIKLFYYLRWVFGRVVHWLTPDGAVNNPSAAAVLSSCCTMSNVKSLNWPKNAFSWLLLLLQVMTALFISLYWQHVDSLSSGTQMRRWNVIYKVLAWPSTQQEEGQLCLSKGSSEPAICPALLLEEHADIFQPLLNTGVIIFFFFSLTNHTCGMCWHM